MAEPTRRSRSTLGEYGRNNGNVLREYVYADSDPVAVIVGQDRYYIHPDHLGTPRAVVDSAGTRLWEWAFQSNPFGEQLPNGDPESTGSTFTLNLRFPGQYYDVESGLHYNYTRDYESATGRYVQSGSIGQFRGINIYSYADQSPLTNIDPLGLEAMPGGRPPEIPRCYPWPLFPSACDPGCWEKCGARRVDNFVRVCTGKCAKWYNGKAIAISCSIWADEWARQCVDRCLERCNDEGQACRIDNPPPPFSALH